MKKLTTAFAVVLFTLTQVNAQDFNKWSIDLGFGAHKPVFPMSSGYRTNTPALWQANISGRYMLNEKFGLRADFGYNKFSEGKRSKPFNSDYYRGTLEGVVNLGSLFNFSDWTKSINLLMHAGAGLSLLKPTSANNSNDKMINMVVGITPQIKLADRVALFLDASTIAHFYQSRSFDGYGTTSTMRISGEIFTASIGLNVYLGKNKTHADWYVNTKNETKTDDDLANLKNRLEAAERKLASLNNKPDFNKSGLISELDNRYSKKGENKVTPVASKVDFIRELLNKGYQNVYFDFGKSSIQKHSLEAVNYLIKYMTENPSTSAQIDGYADELGSTTNNQSLSTRRAKRVYDVLVAAGISPSRLTYKGNGEDASVDKNSEEARQLVRRVTFTVR
ncbi:OmpA family protein [Tenacibaculum sp. UWU-22]|uniref:OmpA family protein n=1 Tax=Tenacibaculum sp. UWU-22 TaxID=3234187 RepID=UPI0034DAC55A